MEEFYKEYRYERTASGLGVHVPKRHRNRLMELSYLRGSHWPYMKVNAESCTVSIVPVTLMFKQCVSLTEVQFPLLFGNDYPVHSKSEATQIIDEIDLLLNPEGFYE